MSDVRKVLFGIEGLEERSPIPVIAGLFTAGTALDDGLIIRRCFCLSRMESSSLRKSSYHMKREKREREKFVSRVISPAIRGQKCPICLDNLTDRRTAVLKVCTHAYCLECIEKWSNLKRNCPLCNAPFRSWFYRINLSSSDFLQQQLQPLIKDKTFISQSHSSPRTPHRSA